jgi:predicted transcriptional regulator
VGPVQGKENQSLQKIYTVEEALHYLIFFKPNFYGQKSYQENLGELFKLPEAKNDRALWHDSRLYDSGQISHEAMEAGKRHQTHSLKFPQASFHFGFIN